jgi:ribosomal protein L13E
VPLHVFACCLLLTHSAQGFSASSLRHGGGFTDARELLRGGYSASELRECGFSLLELQKHLTPQQLWGAGFSAAQLLKHGVELHRLRDIGVAALDVKECGCSCDKLLAAGYDIRALVVGGFTVQDLKAAGCRCHCPSSFAICVLTLSWPQRRANARCRSGS